MDTCICMAKSLHCSLETIPTLLISYIPTQNKVCFFLKKKKICFKLHDKPPTVSKPTSSSPDPASLCSPFSPLAPSNLLSSQQLGQSYKMQIDHSPAHTLQWLPFAPGMKSEPLPNPQTSKVPGHPRVLPAIERAWFPVM